MRNRIGAGRIILQEIRRSKLNSLLCLLSVAVATGLLLAMLSVSRSSVDATRKMMKQMGFNVLITPGGVDPARYQALDFSGADMPEEYVKQLAGSTVLAQHFVGKYQKTIELDGCAVVLTGVLPEITKLGTVKKPMPTAYEVEPGTVKVGWAAAQALEVEAGGTLTIMGREFRIEETLEEAGMSPEDIRVFGHLHDVQEMLGVAGRVNAIDALACHCPVSAKDIVAVLELSVHEVLPDVNVKPYHSILLARHKQRLIIYRLELAALAIVLVGSAAAIWGLTYLNVRHRRGEIGVLRALGVPGWRIAFLFVGKILVYSVSGAALGCVAGTYAAGWIRVTDVTVTAPPEIVAAILGITPIAATLFGLPPIVGGLFQETVDALGDRGA